MDNNITSAAVLSQNNALRVAALNAQSAGSATTQPSSPASSFASLLAAVANSAQPANAPASGSAPGSVWGPPVMAVKPWWITDAKSALAARPSVKQFTDETGLDPATAKELITGVVSPNTDTRNWKAIMASDDPVAAAREATDRKSTRLNSSHVSESRMPSSA